MPQKIESEDCETCRLASSAVVDALEDIGAGFRRLALVLRHDGETNAYHPRRGQPPRTGEEVKLQETPHSVRTLFYDLCGLAKGKDRAREILQEYGLVRIDDAGKHQLDMIGEDLRNALKKVGIR